MSEVLQESLSTDNEFPEKEEEKTWPVEILIKPVTDEDHFWQLLLQILQKIDHFQDAPLSREKFIIKKLLQFLYGSGVSMGVEAISRLKTDVSKIAKHAAIRVHGEIFEYTETRGLKRVEATDEPEFAKKFDTIISGGNITKTPEEFLKWWQSVQENFKSENYNVCRNNSIHFVKAACDFLQCQVVVTLPTDLQWILFWLENGMGTKFLDFVDKLIKIWNFRPKFKSSL